MLLCPCAAVQDEVHVHFSVKTCLCALSESYKSGLIATLAIRLIGLLLVFASQRIVHNVLDEMAEFDANKKKCVSLFLPSFQSFSVEAPDMVHASEASRQVRLSLNSSLNGTTKFAIASQTLWIIFTVEHAPHVAKNMYIFAAGKITELKLARTEHSKG